MRFKLQILGFTFILLLVSCRTETQMEFSSLDDDALLEKISDEAFSKMDATGDDLTKLDEPFKTVAIIYGAQGVIDNGGLRYFFENDWPNNPPYSVFADAYSRIDRPFAAKAIQDAASSFGFDNPEQYADRRRVYMNANYNQEKFSVDGWDDCVCGDELVWANLASWVRKHF